MEWSTLLPLDAQPDLETVGGLVASPLWDQLLAFLAEGYGAKPRLEYSRCAMARGWNVKFRKGSRALCTLYPEEGGFTCLVTMGQKEAVEAQLAMPLCTEYVQGLYAGAGAVNGARWLMIAVTSPEILADVKTLVGIRVKPGTTK